MPCPKINDIGRIVGQPNLKFTPAGKPVLELTLAFGDRRKNEQTQQWEDGDTYWANYAQLWGPKAEAAAQVLADKQLVMVAGKVRTEKWDDKNTGEKKSRDRLIINDIGAAITPQSQGGQQQNQQQGGFGGQQDQGGYQEPPF